MIKHYESLRSHFVAQADSYEPCLPRTLALFTGKGFAAWIQVLCCEASFEYSGQPDPAENSGRSPALQALSALQTELVHLLSTMIETQINHSRT